MWTNAGGAPCRALADTLAAMPATVQDRWFARLFLLFPLAIATLSLFWLVSGLIGLWQAEIAMQVLTSRDIPAPLASLSVYVGAVLCIALGTAILIRRYTRAACLGMIAPAAAISHALCDLVRLRFPGHCSCDRDRVADGHKALTT